MKNFKALLFIVPFLAFSAFANHSFELNRDVTLGEYDKVKSLLAQGADVNQQTKQGFLPLVSAAGIGLRNLRKEMVQLLLDNGADVNGTDKYKDTALIVASFWGRLDTVQLLLDRGAKVDLVNDEGETALSQAKKEGHQEIVDLLSKK